MVIKNYSKKCGCITVILKGIYKKDSVMYGPRGPDKLLRVGQYILLLEIRYPHLLYNLRSKDHCMVLEHYLNLSKVF